MKKLDFRDAFGLWEARWRVGKRGSPPSSVESELNKGVGVGCAVAAGSHGHDLIAPLRDSPSAPC